VFWNCPFLFLAEAPEERELGLLSSDSSESGS